MVYKKHKKEEKKAFRLNCNSNNQSHLRTKKKVEQPIKPLISLKPVVGLILLLFFLIIFIGAIGIVSGGDVNKIKIINAEHLDENRNFIENVFDELKEKDNFWLDVKDGEFVRVTFEEKLTNKKDITVYGKSKVLSQTRSVGSIEVYTEDSNRLLAVINNIFYENWYKTYLSGLNEDESYDTFDLRILGDLGLDYIVDPSAGPNSPSAAVNVDYGGVGAWLSLTNVYTSDDSYTYVITNRSLSGNSDLLRVSGFNFNIPVNATIDGIAVNVEMYNEGYTAMVDETSIMKAGTPLAHLTNYSICIPGSETVVTHGNSTEKWSQSWNYTDINNVEFGVQIYVDDECQVVPSGSVATTYVDHVDITVYYTGGVDSTPPNITINGPTATCYNTDSITFNTTASDDTAMDTCWYTLNGGVDNLTMSNAGTDWTATNTSMAEGSHTVNIYCNDSSGNIGNNSISFTIDTVPPTVSVTSPTNASSSSSTGLDIKFNASGADSCKWTGDAGGTNSSLIATENITNITWGEGEHTISVYCIDDCGNEASDVVYFTIDTAPPIVTITSPGSICSTDTGLDVEYEISGAEDSCWWTSNSGVDNNSLASVGDNITSETWGEGSHTVIVYCNDSSGNIGNNSITFSIDTVPPTVSVTSPTNASSSSSTGLDIKFNASGADSCKWTGDAGGTNSSLIATENITNITWGEGEHTISVYCIDDCGNEASDSISFTINSCSVVAGVSIDSPSANSCSNSAGLDVTYLLTGTSPDSCWWTSNSGGLNSSLTTAGDNITSETWSEGAHTVDVYCNDSCGNEASDSVTFTTDLTSPTATFTCTPGTLTISAVETCACTPTDNAGGCGIDNTATSFTLNPSTAVAGTLTETCTFADLAGNTGSATASYIVEGGGPDPGCCGGGGGGGGGSTPKHCECSEENKCVSVSGEGKDECDFDEDCEGEPELVFEQDSYEFDVNKKVAKFYMILKNIGDAVAENIKVDASDLGLNFPDKLVSVKIEKTTLEPDEETNVIVLVDLTSYDLEKEPILIFNKENILFNKVDDKATYTLILKNIGNIVAENIKVDISSLGLNVPDELVSVEIDKTSLEPEEETKVFVTIDLSDYEGNLEVNSNGITGFSISDLKVSSDRITGFNIDNLKVTEDSREVDAMILGMKIKKKSLFDDLLFLYSLLVFDLLLISLLFHYYGRKRLVYVENKRREEGNKKDE